MELGDIKSLDTELAVPQQTGGSFTPKKGPVINTESFAGVSIKSFPRGVDDGEIMEFLVKCGLPESKRESVRINSGKVIIKELENTECLTLIDVIHGKKHFDQKIFCNGFVPLTPEKITEPESESSSSSQTEKPLPPTVPAVEQPQAVKEFTDQIVKPLPQFETGFSASQPGMGQEKFNFLLQPTFTGLGRFPSDREVVRRHSISIIDRSPPPNSLAADILERSQNVAKSLFNQLADMQESLSDFNSCAEFSAESVCSSDDCDDSLKKNNYLTANDKKREKKKKRKHVQTPEKEHFLLKKANLQVSPQ